MIRVQREDFDVAAELAALPAAGGLCVFVGTVRDVSNGRAIASMTLEHYPGMAERELARLEDEATRRWPLAGVRIVHRFGRLRPAERIVLVAVASAHRAAAFDACHFLIDRLKTDAPFWKVKKRRRAQWVQARREDAAMAERFWDG
ncbi:MAG: molybdenum cofactor biosynthesis protein MoaE [Rhodospirillales bacterium]